MLVTLVFDMTDDNAAALYQHREALFSHFYPPHVTFGYMCHTDYEHREQTYTQISPRAKPVDKKRFFETLHHATYIPSETRNYEQVLADLNRIKTDTIILIGQGVMHDLRYTNINHRHELSKLHKKNIPIHTIQTGGVYKTRQLFNEMSSMTGGHYFNLTLRNLIPYLIKLLLLPPEQRMDYISHAHTPTCRELQRNFKSFIDNTPYQYSSENRKINYLHISRPTTVQALKTKANIGSAKVYIHNSTPKEPHRAYFIVSPDYEAHTGQKVFDLWGKDGYKVFTLNDRNRTIENTEVLYDLGCFYS